MYYNAWLMHYNGPVSEGKDRYSGLPRLDCRMIRTGESTMAAAKKPAKAISKRVDIKVKTLPYSLRAFIGKIMSDDEKFNAFVESPITALVRSNVPIDPTKFTKKDAEHLVLVMGKIHSFVKAKKFARDVTFEGVFNVVTAAGGDVAYVSHESHTHTWVNITPHVQTVSHSHTGMNQNFFQDGAIIDLHQYENVLTAPLISPLAMKTMISEIEVQIDKQLGMIR